MKPSVSSSRAVFSVAAGSAEAQRLELDARIEERRKQQLKEASGRDLLQACLNSDSDSDDEPPPGSMAL